MAKRKWILICAALLLAGIYICYFTDWFKPKIIQISHTERFSPSRTPSQSRPPMILFGFGGRRYRISEIKVVPLADGQVNPAAVPVWHLIADSRSAPVEFFTYGQNLPGMKPAVAGAHAEPLETNVTYRLFLQAGGDKGQCDFQTAAQSPAR
jgi:hypothetical protein